jgi:o-succinylbenzoate---CoA ligase
MARLVALALPAGPAFVDELQRAWDAGDAVFPLDLRLPTPARQRVLDELKPDRLVDERGSTRLGGGRPVEDGDAVVVATSGTTGAPKGVVLTHAAVHASATATSLRLGVDPATDRWLACLPVAHVGGLGVITRALVTGTPVTMMAAFDANEATAAARAGCTLVALVPTAMARLDPALFRTIIVGGSRMPADLPPNAVTTYGMTETGSGVVYDGRALDGVEVRIADDGEIHLRGAMLLRAYRDGHDPKDADGWLPTGDVGSWADDGRLVVHGRRGELIITGGENVWPEAVEAALIGAPGVADVAVIGRDDDEWGQRVVAVVVPASPTDPPSLDALRGVVRAQLPAFCAPRQLVLVNTIERTALGKIRRDQLPR